jgi:hypothetical protein
MPDSGHRFESLSEQFEVLRQKLVESQNVRDRRELLREMLIVLEELDELVLKDPSWLDSKLVSATTGEGIT